MATPNSVLGDVMDPILVAFIGYVLGALFRTTYDALFKYLEDPALKWDQKYTVTMLISIILTVMSSVVTFSSLQLPVGQPFQILLLAIAEGFAVNHIVNKPVAYLAEKAKKEG